MSVFTKIFPLNWKKQMTAMQKHSNMIIINVCPDCVQLYNPSSLGPIWVYMLSSSYISKMWEEEQWGPWHATREVGCCKNKRIYLSWFGRSCCSWSWSQAQGAISWTRRHNMRLRLRHGQSDQNCSFTCWGEVPNIPSPRKATRPSSCWPCAPCSLSSPRRTVHTPLQIE